MTKNKFAKAVVVTAGILFAIPGWADSPNTPSNAAQAPKPAAHTAQQQHDPAPANDFSGLDYTDEQKAQLSKIHQETESQKATVVKDPNLNADQKNAMILGYTRMEYGRTYRVLSPAQQKQVRQRMLARKSADKAATKKLPPSQ
jgi:Spy/CpxP family protein refolding chaperone